MNILVQTFVTFSASDVVSLSETCWDWLHWLIRASSAIRVGGGPFGNDDVVIGGGKVIGGGIVIGGGGIVIKLLFTLYISPNGWLSTESVTDGRE